MEFRSWKAEVIADLSGQWCGNSLRFALPGEAQNYADDLASRWTLVRQTRIVGSADRVTHRFIDGQLRDERIAMPTTAE